MIDIKKAEEEFKKYANTYDMNEEKNLMKFYHTFRVEEICKKLAISLEMDEDEIKLAQIVGLLHDIARFEQYTKYRTHNDRKSVDHGDLGVEILEENKFIRKFIETDMYDEIILKAIKNHNKYAIEKTLNEIKRFLKKCSSNELEEIYDNLSIERKSLVTPIQLSVKEIVRDADKIDIFYLAVDEIWKNEKEEIEKEIITPKVLEQFINGETIDKRNLKNHIDSVILILAFIYDFNIKDSYKIINENRYVDKIIDRFNFIQEQTQKQIEDIREIVNEYIDNKCRGN